MTGATGDYNFSFRLHETIFSGSTLSISFILVPSSLSKTENPPKLLENQIRSLPNPVYSDRSLGVANQASLIKLSDKSENV